MGGQQFGIPPKNISTLDYTGADIAIEPVTEAQRDPLTTDTNYPIDCFWRNTVSKTLWWLSGFSSGNALWIKLTGGATGPAIQFPVPSGTSPVVADSSGNITFTSSSGTVTITGGTNAINFDLSGGTSAIEKIAVDTFTAPGTNPIIASGSGQVSITGSLVNTGQFSSAVRTDSLAANAFNIQIQRSGSNASVLTANNFGVSQFDSNQFNVVNGFVQLAGGTTAPIQTLTGNTGGAIQPTSGNITTAGASTIYITGSGVGHSLTPEVSFTNKTFLYGKSFGTTASTIGPLTDGQLIIGSTAGDSSAATLTAGAGVTITNASNSITISTIESASAGAFNIGITYSAGTFTVNSANGTAFSVSNPGYIALQSATAGQLQTVSVTSNQTFTDGAGGNIDTWQGGVPPTDDQGGVSSNWAQDMPFYLYAVLGTSNDIAFMFSRNPAASTSPVAASISKTGTILNTGQGDFFSLLGGTIANYSSRPCLCIGSFRMRNVVNSANIRYTVQSLNSHDGIGQYQENVLFSFPTGVNGAVAGRYFSNAGTSPTFTTMASVYQILRNGRVFYNVRQENCNNSGSVSGANQLQLALPYANGSASEGYNNWLSYTGNSSGNVYCVLAAISSASRTTSATSFFHLTGTNTGIVNTSIAANDSLEGQIIYNSFI